MLKEKGHEKGARQARMVTAPVCEVAQMGQRQASVSSFGPGVKGANPYSIYVYYFLSNFYAQHGARTHDFEIKSGMLCQLSQPDAPLKSTVLFSMSFLSFLKSTVILTSAPSVPCTMLGAEHAFRYLQNKFERSF